MPRLEQDTISTVELHTAPYFLFCRLPPIHYRFLNNFHRYHFDGYTVDFLFSACLELEHRYVHYHCHSAMRLPATSCHHLHFVSTTKLPFLPAIQVFRLFIF